MASSTSSYSDKLSNVSDKSTKVLTNDYVISILSVIAVAYVSTFAPKLPKSVARPMDNIVVKFLMFFIIAFVVVRKVDVALIASLAVLALVMALQVYNTKEHMHGNGLTSEPAPVSIDANGNYTENSPLGENWTQQVPKKVMGRADAQYPTYEEPDKMPESLSTCSWNGPQMSCGGAPAAADVPNPMAVPAAMAVPKAMASLTGPVSSMASKVVSDLSSMASSMSTNSSIVASNEVHSDESEVVGIQGISPMSSPMASLAIV